MKTLPPVKDKEQWARDNVHQWLSNEEWRYFAAREYVMLWGIDRAANHLAVRWAGTRTDEGVAYTRNRIKYALMLNFENVYEKAVNDVREFFKHPNSTLFAKMRLTSNTGTILRTLREAGFTHVGEVPFSQKNIRDAFINFDKK